MRCPDCERYMTAGFSRGRSKLYPYYCCRNRSCNSGGSYPSDSVHREFEGFLAQIAPKPEIVEKLGEAVVQVAQEKQALGKAERAQRLADRDRLERQRQELIRMKMEGLITDREFVAQREMLTERRMSIDARLQAQQFDPEEIRNNLDEVKRPLSELKTTWEAFSPALQRRFNRLALPVGFVYGQIGTAETALLFRTFRGFATANSIGVPFAVENLNRLMQEISAFAGILRSVEEEEMAA